DALQEVVRKRYRADDLAYGHVRHISLQRLQRIERRDALAETRIGNGEGSVDPADTGLLQHGLALPPHGLSVVAGFEIGGADPDEPMGIVAGSGSEAYRISEMPNGELWFPQIGFEPAAALPRPGAGRIERQRACEQSVCSVKVVHHCDGATGGYD